MKWLFLPAIAGKPWNGNTVLSQPLGGSEAAVAYLAQALSLKGHDVTVVSHGEPGPDYRNVMYHHVNNLPKLLSVPFDVVVSSRWPEALDQPWQTSFKFFWSHDMIPGLNVRANAAVFLSQYHADSVMYDGKKAIIGDGVADELIDITPLVPAEKRELRLIWTSNPDRGTALAAHIFQKIRARWPDMQFHIYGRASVYGWGPEAESAFLPRPEDMENVFIHEPLPRAQLMRELAKSWAMFYPTYWPETFCMAALEAQAAGTPVIASPFGALNETVKGGVLTYDFLNAVSQLRNRRRWDKLSAVGMEWASENTWSKVADKWLSLTD